MKMKEFGSRGGASLTPPPRSANDLLFNTEKISFFSHDLYLTTNI